jgi:DMSO/TMAO reductase YedYZ heme-binding membrane subunit
MFKFDQKIYELWAKFYAEEQGFISFVFDSVFNKTGSDILGMNMYAFWSGLIGIIIMFFLLVTSNNVSQRIV